MPGTGLRRRAHNSGRQGVSQWLIMWGMQNLVMLIGGGIFVFVFLLPSKKMLSNNNPLGALVWFSIGCVLAYYGWKEFGGLTYTPNTDF